MSGCNKAGERIQNKSEIKLAGKITDGQSTPSPFLQILQIIEQWLESV